MDMFPVLCSKVQESLSDNVSFEHILERNDGTSNADKSKIILDI